MYQRTQLSILSKVVLPMGVEDCGYDIVGVVSQHTALWYIEEPALVHRGACFGTQ